jgi:hypothetical protein
MHLKPSIPRTLLAGLADGVAFVLGTVVTFAQLAGSRRGQQGLLFDPDTQSEKVIAVWKQLEPLPRVIETPVVILGGMVVFGIAYAFVYRSVAAAWPVGVHRRAWRLALVVWLAGGVLGVHGTVQRATPAAVAQRGGVGLLGRQRGRRGLRPGLDPGPRPIRTHQRAATCAARRPTGATLTERRRRRHRPHPTVGKLEERCREPIRPHATQRSQSRNSTSSPTARRKRR